MEIKRNQVLILDLWRVTYNWFDVTLIESIQLVEALEPTEG